MIGVSRFAGAAGSWSPIGAIPYFAQSRWMDVQPEYIPFKYDSFPALRRAADRRADRRDRRRRGRGLEAGASRSSRRSSRSSRWWTRPSRRRPVDGLFALPDNGSELVLFDVNRFEVMGPFLKRLREGGRRPLRQPARPYRLSLVTNAAETRRTPSSASRRRGPRASEVSAAGPRVAAADLLALAPRRALRADDPLFGIAPDMSVSYGLRLGLRGASRRARRALGLGRPVHALELQSVLPVRRAENSGVRDRIPPSGEVSPFLTSRRGSCGRWLPAAGCFSARGRGSDDDGQHRGHRPRHRRWRCFPA